MRPLFFALICTAAFPQTQQSTGTAAINGRVLNSVTGDPVAGASLKLIPLRLLRGANRTTLTGASDSTGAFHFDSLDEGMYRIAAEASGFIPASFREGRVEVGAGQLINDAVIRLTPESTISGVVYDDQGKPAEDVLVHALEKHLSYGRVVYTERQSTPAKGGSFRIAHLRPGRYVLAAESINTQKPTPAGELVKTFFPRGLSVNEAQDVEVTPGDNQTGVKIYLRRAAAFHVRGKVEPGLNRWLPQLILSPQGADIDSGLSRTVPITHDKSQQDVFEIPGVLPGSYVLRMVSGGRQRSVFARAEFEVRASDVNNVFVQETPAVQVTGTVAVEGGDTPVQTGNVVVAISLPLPGRTMMSQPDENAGEFRFPGLSAGQWFFTSGMLPPGYYLASLTAGGQDVMGRAMDLEQTPIIHLEAVLRPGPGAINATVQVESGESASGIWVVLVPKTLDAAATNVQIKRTDQNGAVRFAPLRPDEYTLFTIAEFDANLWHNLAFLSGVLSQGAQVQVAESQVQTVQLKPVPEDVIASAAQMAGLQ